MKILLVLVAKKFKQLRNGWIRFLFDYKGPNEVFATWENYGGFLIKKPGVLVQSVHLVRMAYPPLKNGNGFAMPNTSPLFNVSPHSRKDFPSSILAIIGASVKLCLSSEQLSNWILLPSEIKKVQIACLFQAHLLSMQ